jgi:hypothetical protein
MRLPKIPKGLSSRLRKLETKLARKKKADARRKEIAAMKKRAETLAAQLRK